MNTEVRVSKDNGGWDITVYVGGERVKTAWKQNFDLAYRIARDLSLYYRDENGQTSVITVDEGGEHGKAKQ